MTPRSFAPLLLAAFLGLAACDAFEDKTPRQARVRITGTAGQEATVIFSSQFVAGVTETGVTQVSVFESDTLTRTLPIDTIVDIEVSRRLFFELAPAGASQAVVRVRVDIDDRGIFNEEGDIFSADPFRYIYLFNEPTTRVIEVI